MKRTCKKCNNTFPLSKFWKQGGTKRTYYSKNCKDCIKIGLKNKAGNKICSECLIEKPLSEFGIGPWSHLKRCKNCCRKIKRYRFHFDFKYRTSFLNQRKDYDKRNREKCTENLKKWKAKNPDKVEACRLNYLQKHRVNHKKYYDKLPDSYVKRSFVADGLKYVPPELIELKRLQIIALRELKKQIK